MCVVALALGRHPDYPLILIGNRDEFHARPSAPIHKWQDGSGIMAGQDLRAGGTWLGIHPASSRIVVVTNIRGVDPDPSKSSRGALVTQILTGSGPYAQPRLDQLDEFNAFNLLTVEAGEARIITNRPAPLIERMTQGIIALANVPAFTPCPRAERLHGLLSQCAASGSDPHDLLNALRQEDDPALFLRDDDYGTRVSTLLTINEAGDIEMTENQYEAGGRPAGTTALKSRLA
jgi:uncharacterized protein with NRDE domain